ncbi:DUF4241 domain-containing protein [Halpernia frigidisoli]|uniref:DUF4241 domain-containing protein n=1 Tax=Halpernia frigidisoli TaxID=1125876 RepID=A0A1I3FPU0_9FLAO|nr:DUF4241 domain-containing protein [Halpernia frigidisoli]SFI13200.1 Protein of unknown function [Halpernia frigidisoli]
MKHIENLTKLFSQNLADNILIDTFEAEDLHISSGQIIACDPVITNDKVPFLTQFPVGDFPVLIHKEKESNCIAYVEVTFSKNSIKKWELAVCEDQKISSLKEGEIFGYPVESGMGCFMDLETQTALNQLEVKLYVRKGEDFMGIYEEFFHPFFYDTDGLVNQFATLKPDSEKEENLIAFETGYGEGFYASYIAFDAEDKPVKIISEFIEMA